MRTHCTSSCRAANSSDLPGTYQLHASYTSFSCWDPFESYSICQLFPARKKCVHSECVPSILCKAMGLLIRLQSSTCWISRLVRRSQVHVINSMSSRSVVGLGSDSPKLWTSSRPASALVAARCSLVRDEVTLMTGTLGMMPRLPGRPGSLTSTSEPTPCNGGHSL